MTFASKLLAKPPHRNPNSLFIKETGCVGAVVVNALSQLEDHRLVTEAIRETISRLFASVPKRTQVVQPCLSAAALHSCVR
jgi:hypothetical protein